MKCFISGGAKNGKSTLAQNLAVSLANGGKHYYVATMIPVDEEDEDRIARHVADRDGLEFETLECGKDILSCLEHADKEGVFLLDSATALLQNALFPVEKNYALDIAGAEKCADDLITFVQTVRHVVVVSDYIYSNPEEFDETTEIYCQGLAKLDRRLAQVCDTVVEVCAGQSIVYKGELGL